MPTFDLFRGHYRDKDGAMWVEAVEGIAAARARMYEIATENPGPYFVFSTGDQMVVALTDTNLIKPKAKEPGAA